VSELRIGQHPRARNGVRRARGVGGLVGFVLGAWLAHAAALPLTDVLLRGLLAGVGAHCAAWLLAVTYWRAAILAELETARRRREIALAEAADRLLRETAAAGQQTA
jgi:hypothetical protein